MESQQMQQKSFCIVKTAKFMQKIYPAQLGNKTDEEIFGAGPYHSKPVSNCVIEIAADEQTVSAGRKIM